MSVQLDVQTITLDANGAGTIRIQVHGGQSWEVSSITTSSSAGPGATGVNFTLKVFVNQSQVLNSVTAQLDTADGTPVTVRRGDQLVAQYAGGTPGATVTFTVSGEMVL